MKERTGPLLREIQAAVFVQNIMDTFTALSELRQAAYLLRGADTRPTFL